MIQKSTLKLNWNGAKIFSLVTLFSSLFAFDASSQQTWDYEFTNDFQIFEVPVSGPYKLEAWGAGGGEGTWSNVERIAGNGGYAAGEVDLVQGDILYIYVGEKPNRVVDGAAGGGGATDFRFANGDETWMSSEGLYSRILVAGGGSGSHGGAYSEPDQMGAGGGSTATVSYYNELPSSDPATQSTGGSDNLNSNAYFPDYEQNGAFGYAGYALSEPMNYVGNHGGFNGGGNGCNWAVAGGGGGWYGGATCWPQGGGGSGYVLTSSSFRPDGYDPSSIYEFNEEELIAGNMTMLDPNGDAIVGNSGNGHARVTLLYKIDLIDLTDATCIAEADGSISTVGYGGTPPYSFLWSDGQTTATASNLIAGDYTVTMTDLNGLEASRTFTVGPDSIEIDFVMTESATCDETGNGALEAQVSGGTAPYSYVWSTGETEATISNKTIGEYTVSVIDANNCVAVEASANIMSDDNTVPTVLVKSANIYLDEDGLATVRVQDINDGSYDDCSIGSIFVFNPDFDCLNNTESLGLSATLVVIDVSGNEASAQANINLIDTIKPIVAVRNIDVFLDQDGLATIEAMDIDNESSDNCFIISRELSVSSFSCEDLGEHEVTMFVRDISGNERQAVSIVTVKDVSGPVVPDTLQMDVYLDDEGAAIFNAAPLLAQASDNCGVSHIGDLEGHNDIDGFPLNCAHAGLADGVLVVVDVNGNATEFNAEFTIIDTIKPVFHLNFIEIEIDSEGVAHLTEEMLLPYATDNCLIAEVAIEINAFDCSQMGASQFTEIVVIDRNGNAKQQTLEVQVIDATAPEVQVENITLELNANGEAALDLEMLQMVAVDNCEIISYALSQAEFNCADIGSQVMSVSVLDGSGNTGIGEFTVSVLDKINPEISGPQVIKLCEGVPVNYDAIVATDNCFADISVVEGPLEGETPEVGEFVVEFKAFDTSGNAVSKIIMLVVDPIAVVDLGEDMEVEAGSIVTLTAGESNANEYVWSNGSTGAVYEFVATEQVSISVEVRTPNGCISSDQIDIHISNILGIDEDEAGNSVRFYPNPTKGQMSIALSLTEVATDVQISILDISGKTVAQSALPTAKDGDVIALDLSNFAKGIYLVNVQSDSFSLTERVVKQ